MYNWSFQQGSSGFKWLKYFQAVSKEDLQQLFFPHDMKAAPAGSGDTHRITCLWSLAAHWLGQIKGVFTAWVAVDILFKHELGRRQYKHNWKCTNPVSGRVPQCTVLCAPTGNPVDFKNTAALRFPLCAQEIKPFFLNRLEHYYIEDNKAYC